MREEVPPAEPVWSLREGLRVEAEVPLPGDGAALRDAPQTTGKGTPLLILTSLLSSFQPVPPIGQTQLEASKDTEQVGKVRVGLQMGNI